MFLQLGSSPASLPTQARKARGFTVEKLGSDALKMALFCSGVVDCPSVTSTTALASLQSACRTAGLDELERKIHWANLRYPYLHETAGGDHTSRRE